MKNYLKYAVRDAIRSLNRHKGMVVASVLTITITLVVLGATALLSANSQYAVKDMEQELEVIAFLHEDVSREDALALQVKIEGLSGFKETTFVPKEEALISMDNRLGQDTELLEAMGGDNPLPDAYKVKAQTTEEIQGIVDALSTWEEVELVRYGEDLVNDVIVLSQGIQFASLVMIVAMIIAALFLVNSTIRLTVFARSDEITIMRYVGANNSYIRAPFFLEGLIIGLLGSVIASLVVYFGYNKVAVAIMDTMSFVTLMTDSRLLLVLCGCLILGGATLGAIGSMIALRKYLRA